MWGLEDSEDWDRQVLGSQGNTLLKYSNDVQMSTNLLWRGRKGYSV